MTQNHTIAPATVDLLIGEFRDRVTARIQAEINRAPRAMKDPAHWRAVVNAAFDEEMPRLEAKMTMATRPAPDTTD